MSWHIIAAILLGVGVIGLMTAGFRKTRRTKPHTAPELGDVGSVSSAEEIDFSLGEYGDGVIGEARLVGESGASFSQTAPQTATSISDGYIVMRLMAPAGKTFTGYDLLQCLLGAGLRYGDMNIFHRYEGEDIIFSLASVVEPGTININEMGSFSSPGLCLFMNLNQQKNPGKSLGILLEAANQLADDLQGELYDDAQQPLNNAQMEHWQRQADIQHKQQLELEYE